MSTINNNNSYPDSYLKSIQNEVFTRMDKAGDSNGKVTVNEALQDLNIGSLLDGQNTEDTAKIKAKAQNIEKVLQQYAGEDGVFQAEEWAAFLNGKEWGAVLDAWHSSGKKAQFEMQWTDNAHIEDNQVTKGEVKVGILNNLIYNNISVDTKGIEELIDKYAGEDGTFTLEEFIAMKNDPIYKNFIEQHRAAPWFKFGV